jgi:hypothetical protein
LPETEQLGDTCLGTQAEDAMSKTDQILRAFADQAIAPIAAHEAELILPNMRGACVTVGKTVHTLFRLAPTRQTKD